MANGNLVMVQTLRKLFGYLHGVCVNVFDTGKEPPKFALREDAVRDFLTTCSFLI